MPKPVSNKILFALGVCAAALLTAQAPPPQMGPGELDNLVQRIALYPDAMLANVLTAATFPDQIPEADQWADQHAGIHGEALARAINEDHLPWDPSVQALLPFPQVLEMMARDIAWTQRLGDAVLAQRGDVMEAVQRMRHAAERYGYLQTNAYYNVVNSGGYIEINPINPGVFVVPVYDPGIVFVAPRPGFAVRAAISFGPRITLGTAFAPWGWGPGVYARFNWGGHGLFVNNHEWGRTWEIAPHIVTSGLCLIMKERAVWSRITCHRRGDRKRGVTRSEEDAGRAVAYASTRAVSRDSSRHLIGLIIKSRTSAWMPMRHA